MCREKQTGRGRERDRRTEAERKKEIEKKGDRQEENELLPHPLLLCIVVDL